MKLAKGNNVLAKGNNVSTEYNNFRSRYEYLTQHVVGWKCKNHTFWEHLIIKRNNNDK